ncbi:May24p SCDLUD_002370, partial [Saccharomycodes ludwigii]|uniref:May24p n=1 Tax=Saccharomycodes ludwigii TaxID=36035 RepID=UPI001E89743A
SSFVTYEGYPVGYVTPSFPSLYWPINNKKYTVSYLYYTEDIWKFTLYWTLIFFAGFYLAAGIIAVISHRRSFWVGLVWVIIYLLVGGCQALISGTCIGLLTAAIYRAGLFSMSTWIPLSLAVVQILFNALTSYRIYGVII